MEDGNMVVATSEENHLSERGQSGVFTQGGVHVGCSVHFFLWPVANGWPLVNRAEILDAQRAKHDTGLSPRRFFVNTTD
jgi:hypothetical protein